MMTLAPQQERRRLLIRELMGHPFYLRLAAPQRLKLIKRLEAGSSLTAALLRLDMHQWLKTGVVT